MTKRFRKILSILCALALLTACAGTAFADDGQPAETPDEAATEAVTGEEPGADPDEGNDTPDKTPEGTPAAGNSQDGAGDDSVEIPGENLPAAGGEEGTGGEEGGNSKPSDTEPGTTEVVSDAVTIEEAVEQANNPAGGEPPASNEPTEEGTPADVTPPADQTGGQDDDSQNEAENPPAENEPEGDPQEGGQQDGQEKEPESESGEDPVIEPEEDPVIEPEQDEDENGQEEEPEDESENESGEEQDESEDLVILKLGERTQVSSIVTRERPYTLKAVDEYSRMVIFTLIVPSENAVSVTVNNTPVTLNKTESEDPDKTDITYTFEYPLLQGEDYIVTLTAEQDGYIPFDLSIEKKPDEKPQEETPQTPEESTDAGEENEETDSGLEEGKEELPDNRNAIITISWDDENPTYGSVAHFHAELIGYEDVEYTLQWQWSEDGVNWSDAADAVSEDMDVIYTEQNGDYRWRITVDAKG